MASMHSTLPSEPAIETRGLGKTFGSARGARGRRPRRPARRRVRLPRRQRRRQDDADPAAARPRRADRGQHPRARPRRARGARRGARARRRDHRGAALPPHLTGRENLRVHAAARDAGRARGRIDASLARVGLAARADDKVKTYSLGMRQRLGVARCLLGDPELLILDEPLNGLDPAGHPRDAPADPRVRRRGPHGAAVLAPARRGREDLRRRGDRRRGQGRRPGHDPASSSRRHPGDRHRLPRPGRGGRAARGGPGRHARRRPRRRDPRDARPRGAGRSRDRHRAAAPPARPRRRRRAHRARPRPRSKTAS